jgi:hypothetical protein
MIQWPPLWSSGQSYWLQIQRSGFDSWRYQIFWEVVGLEWDPLSLVSTLESSGSCLEIREYGRRDPSHWPHGTLHPQKLALLPTKGCLSVGIVRLWTQATEFSFSFYRDPIVVMTQMLPSFPVLSRCLCCNGPLTVTTQLLAWSHCHKFQVTLMISLSSRTY